jgi:hypothetical protein
MWTYFILKENQKYWLVELFYESKYKKTPKKISWYTDFIIEWESKTQILNIVLKLMNWKIKLEESYNKEDYIMMYKDIKKCKFIDVSSIKFFDIRKKI